MKHSRYLDIGLHNVCFLICVTCWAWLLLINELNFSKGTEWGCQILTNNAMQFNCFAMKTKLSDFAALTVSSVTTNCLLECSAIILKPFERLQYFISVTSTTTSCSQKTYSF